MVRTAFGASCAALTLLLLAGCGSSAAGGDAAGAYIAAADALSAKLAAAGSGGQVPGPSDPAVTAFEAESQKALSALGTPALPVTGFDSYEQICGRAAKVVGAYINFGVDRAAPDAKAALMNSNANQYMNQMFTPLLFSAHCSAAHMPFIEKSTTAEDFKTKAAALQQIRGGAYAQASGLLEMASSKDLDPARRSKIVGILAADSRNFAIPLSAVQRQSLAAGADALPADANNQAIKAGFSLAPCGPLCAM